MSALNGSKVTDGSLPPSAGRFEPPPSERETEVIGGTTLRSPLTEREGGRVVRRVFVWLKGQFEPPALLTERAPAIAEIRRVAHEAPWSGTGGGALRALGLAWCYCVAIPAILRSRLREWVWQQPIRFIAVAVTVKLLAELPPVEWLVDNVIKPGVEFALWLFV